MKIFEILHVLLEDKLKRCHEDYIDIRLDRYQAIELYETLHRIITYDKNMKGDKKTCSNT